MTHEQTPPLFRESPTAGAPPPAPHLDALHLLRRAPPAQLERLLPLLAAESRPLPRGLPAFRRHLNADGSHHEEDMSGRPARMGNETPKIPTVPGPVGSLLTDAISGSGLRVSSRNTRWSRDPDAAAHVRSPRSGSPSRGGRGEGGNGAMHPPRSRRAEPAPRCSRDRIPPSRLETPGPAPSAASAAADVDSRRYPIAGTGQKDGRPQNRPG